MKWTKFSASSIIRSLCDSSWDMSSKAGKETIPKEYSKNTPRILQEYSKNEEKINVNPRCVLLKLYEYMSIWLKFSLSGSVSNIPR